MDEDDFYDPGDEDGLDWYYLEDDYPLQDELAETQIADPGYAGTNYAIEMESYEFDLFEYWDDLEYGMDTYWDNASSLKDTQSTNTGVKRKREDAVQREDDEMKKRAKNLAEMGADNVCFVSGAERIRRYWEPPPFVNGKLAAWALLPDWRERFAGVKSFEATRSMPAEMRRAAEGGGLEREEDEGEGSWEDDGEDDEGEGQGDGLSIDPEMLKSVLRQRLGEAGLKDMDESAFMEAIAQMLNGDGDSSGVAADLAQTLLDKVTEGNDDEGVSGWLSQEGISFDASEDEIENEEPESTSTLADGHVKGTRTTQPHPSPSDSAVDVARHRNLSRTKPPDPGDASGTSSKKRMAPADNAETPTKRSKLPPRTPAATRPQSDRELPPTDPPSSKPNDFPTSSTSRKRKAEIVSENHETTQPFSKRTAGREKKG